MQLSVVLSWLMLIACASVAWARQPQVPVPPASTWPLFDQPRAAAPPTPRSSAETTDLDRALADGDYERAERLLAAAIDRQPAARPLLTRIAGIFMLDRKPLNAAVALKKAEVLRALDARERLQLALAYIAMQRDDWARPELETLLRDRPDDVAPRYWLARLDYNAGQYASAVARLDEVVKRQPGFARAHDNLGLSYEALNQVDEAIPHYREAVRLTRLEDPPSPWPAVNLAILLRSRGELEEAETLLREARDHDAACAPAHYQLGVLLEQAGRLEEAVAALRQATSIDAQYAEPFYALSRIARRQGHIAEADEALHTFERLHDVQRAPEAPPR